YREPDAGFAHGGSHTSETGERGADGQIYFRGRKKEMIVTPEGLNVFPEDVERVLNRASGVRDSAVVGLPIGGEERVHAVLVLEPGTNADDVVREANAQLDDDQKIRRAMEWTDDKLARTDCKR